MLTCECCGETSVDVETIIDPYQADVDDTDVEMDLCPQCEQDRADDI